MAAASVTIHVQQYSAIYAEIVEAILLPSLSTILSSRKWNITGDKPETSHTLH